MYYLGKHPDVQKKLQEEVDSVLQGNLPTPETLNKLKYLKMTLQETLRLRSPLDHVPRELAHDGNALLKILFFFFDTFI